ncbi:MAG: 4-alpha-glucanotransferase [Clostridia bacterium]|jgi:4-alpha-glucanotransferase|nr:4-alpha-glucanotransferase [Clostridia bacterium]MBR3037433.1 4-alpha-glucanotransferase [Clostridia bacterium]
MKRACGILMHITSLPSRFGIGTLGKEAFAFVDFLSAAGQSYWQMLPVTPTGYADSPYQSSSTYAGNPYLIDLDELIERGLLTEAECDVDWGDDPTRVDYGKMWEHRFDVLKKAFARFDRSEMADFVKENASWLDTYALFCAVKAHFNGASWYEWPDPDIQDRTPEGIARYTALLHDEIDFQKFMQYEFASQWEALRRYANKNGIQLIGDLPIYVPHDSADVWADPDLFYLDEKHMPTLIAGVPPDYFSELGQLWGNPIYRWDVHEADGFAWWQRRVKAAATRYDVLRIDHFRGIESYWGVPYGATDARPGAWYKGPDMKLINAIKKACPKLPIIAEDLGYLTPEVKRMLSESGFPGMRIMQFGFDPCGNSRELPHNYPVHSIAYTGTHDNTPIMGWVETAPAECVAFAVDYLGLNEREGMPFGFARGVLNSVAELAILQMQDYLGLGDDCRMNNPSTTGWWRWRAEKKDFTVELAARIRYYARMSARAPESVKSL